MSDAAGKVVALGRMAATPGPVQDVVDILRDLLTRAEAGEIRALAVNVVDGGNVTSHEWCQGTASLPVLIGGVARMQHKMLDLWDER